MSDEEDNLPVISLDAYRIERGSRYCSHASRIIDPNVRALRCDECGAQLDAFDCLLQIARDADHLAFRKKELKRQIAKLTARVEELKRVESNARARLKRLSIKSTEDC